MDFYQHDSYRGFSEALKSSFKKKSNLLLISVPGMSVTFYIQKFLERETGLNYKHVQSDNEALSLFNILDLNFDKNPNAIKVAERYFLKADPSQKFAVVVNTPQILNSDTFRDSIISSHIYSSYYFQPLDKELIKIFVSILGVDLSGSDIDKIFTLSGGMTRAVKFLITHRELLDSTPKEIIADESFQRVFASTTGVIELCTDKILERLGIKKNGVYVGSILKEYFSQKPNRVIIDIKINPDLTFSEKDVPNPKSLLKTERLIITAAMENDGVIAKERIADLKWGEGSYDKYSDQAIGKAIFRLKNKLQKYTIIPVKGYGYKIIEK